VTRRRTLLVVLALVVGTWSVPAAARMQLPVVATTAAGQTVRHGTEALVLAIYRTPGSGEARRTWQATRTIRLGELAFAAWRDGMVVWPTQDIRGGTP